MPELSVVQSPAEKEFSYFMSKFKGHTTIVTATYPDDEGNQYFTNHVNPSYDKLKKLNDLGHDIYFTVNETNPEGRKAENLEAIRAVFADDDDPRSEPKKFPLEPSIITQTSKHGDKYKHHYYWLTETEDYKTWEQVLLGIIAVYGMDTSVHDLARILRVPGFFNNKHNPPTQCKLIQCSGTVYDWDEILKAFPPLPKERVAEVKGHTGGKINEVELRARFANPIESGWVTNSMNSLIQSWAHNFSIAKINRKLDEMFEAIDPEIKEQYKERYFKAYKDINKFSITAKDEVNAIRAKESRENSIVSLKLNEYDEIPLNLEWDWSVLKSNSFTEEYLPKYLLEAAKEIGNWTGVGKDPAIVSAMAITSSLLSKNVVIHETFDQLTHFCAQGSIIVMDTGGGKSAIYEAMNQPFFDYDTKIKEEWEKTKNVSTYMIKALETELANNEKRYNPKNSQHSESEMMAHAKEQGELQDKIDNVQVVRPSLYTNDITEEAAFDKMFDNKGAIALISDDARQPINILLGMYKNGMTGEGIYIKGMSGTSMTNDRKGKASKEINSPALNVLYFVQPDQAIKLRDSDMYVPSGLAARMPMFFYPTSGVDIIRNRQRRDVDHSILSPYYERLRNICLNRMDHPLHVVLTEEGRLRCKEFDHKFADMLEGSWHGEFAKLNKFVSTSLQYATCFASMDDPDFAIRFKSTKDRKDYTLSIKYMNMGFEYAKVLFQQSVVTQNSINEESIPRKANTFVTKLKKLYETNKIYEGFVNQGDFRNAFPVSYREELPQIIEFLLERKWLFTTKHEGSKRKLNSGFPNKLVDEDDLVLHLNIKGINKRARMKLDKIEDRSNG